MPTTNILDLNNRVTELEKNASSGGGTAENITYDNTDSGLTADTVQDAIDELASDLSGLSADDVTYDNTDSGLTADTVQDAIDEIAPNTHEIVTLTVTAGTGSTSDAVKLADYPTGFTKANTIILGAVSFNSSGVGISWNGASKYTSIWTLLLKDNGIYGEWDNTDINGSTTKITIMKI